MTMRLFCVIGIALCAAVTLLAPPYQGVAEILGFSFLGLATISTLLGQA